MTPQQIVAGTGQAHRRPAGRQARRGHRAAQPLAPHAGRRAAAPRDHAQEHPDDRPHRLRQDRDRAPPGAAGQCAVREGGGHQVHRGGLRRPRGGFHHQGPGRSGREDDARGGKGARARPRRGCRRGARARCAAAATARRWAFPPTNPRSRAMPRRARRFRKMLREGELDEREIEIEVARACQAAWRSWRRPAWKRCSSSCQQMFSNLGARPHARATREGARGAEAAARRRSRQAGQRGGDQAPARWPMPSRTASCSSTRSTRSRAARTPSAPTCHAKACSATCCRWSRAARCRPSTARIKTDHILFIASGAFHMSKPSDLIPELQGRLPDPRGAGGAERRGLRAHPHRAGCLADRAVPRAAGHRDR